MSIRIMTRVWDEATLSGGALLVLLALADIANDDGVCWPSRAVLARRARLTERQVSTVLTKLATGGHIATLTGRGRGQHTVYCVLTGLSAEQADERRAWFRHAFGGTDERPEKREVCREKREETSHTKREETSPLPDENGKFVTEKREVCDRKTGSLRHAPEPTFDASESVASPSDAQCNRQGTVIEPPPPTEPPAAPALTKEEEQKILRMLIGKYHVGSEDYQNKLIAACPDADTLDASLAALLAGGMTIGPAMRAIIRTPPAVGEPYQKQALARRPAAPAPAPEGARRELTPDETRQRLAELRARQAQAGAA